MELIHGLSVADLGRGAMFLFQPPLFSDVIYHPGLHVFSKVKNSYNMKNITNSTSFELMTIRYS